MTNELLTPPIKTPTWISLFDPKWSGLLLCDNFFVAIFICHARAQQKLSNLFRVEEDRIEQFFAAHIAKNNVRIVTPVSGSTMRFNIVLQLLYEQCGQQQNIAPINAEQVVHFFALYTSKFICYFIYPVKHICHRNYHTKFARV